MLARTAKTALTIAEEVNAKRAFSLTLDESKYFPLIFIVLTILGHFFCKRAGDVNSELYMSMPSIVQEINLLANIS